MRVLIVANMEKARVRPAVEQWLPWLKARVEVVGVETDRWGDLGASGADVILVMGGDGTLLSVARRLNGRPIPLMGVNFGRLGFLASFTPEEFAQYFEAWREGKLPVSRRQVLEASVVSGHVDCDVIDCNEVERKRHFHATALNDAVVTAGPPFHMVELELGVDGYTGVKYFGDGVIVATPSGSTAYNLSAGGPILTVGVEAFCITPICAHSLSFRPVVISSKSTVIVGAVKVNPGTTLFCDGQASVKLTVGDRVVLRRSPHDVLLVENPASQQWRSLAEKLNWAVTPKYNGAT